MSEHQYTNRLARETSPYLQKHAHNPVDWFPWGPEALEKAKAEDKPILLSIGYSSCHWCNVMHEESFENKAIADLMNHNFVSIKVDREERPDLDTIYMNAVQMMTGHGGWPMTVFLTPDGVPFYGGTYYPPTDRRGMPGFPRVLISIAEAYRDQREQIAANAETLTSQLASLNQFNPVDELTAEVLDSSVKGIMRAFDTENGGFGRAPKFPPAMVLSFLLRRATKTNDPALIAAIRLTLDKMARGGMYDQLGGGFHRYSVDEKWLVPHFEKMLYDNALLSRLYLDFYLYSGDSEYRETAEDILEYVMREMTSPEGGFYTSQDADSEGEEGLFFVWRPEEVLEVLGAQDAAVFNAWYDVTPHGNFEHATSILNVENPGLDTGMTSEVLKAFLASCRKKLFDVREKRVKPARDEKILSGWNGLMLRSFAEAARATGRKDFLDTAIACAEFVCSNLLREGRLLRTFKDGEARLNAYHEDYAYLIDGLLALYEATFDERWYSTARDLTDKMVELFWDAEGGAFFFTSTDHEQLITRTKEAYDNAVPSGNSVAADTLQRLFLLTGESRYEELAVTILKTLVGQVSRYPNAFGHLLCALDAYLGSPVEIAIAGDPGSRDTRELLEAVNTIYHPDKVVALAKPGSLSVIKLLEGREMPGNSAVAYVCRNFVCKSPVTSPEALLAALQNA